MKNRTYTIIGALKFTQPRRGAAGLTVQAWDKDLLFDDALGSAITDAEGGFRITFTEARFRHLFGERRPDLYFRVCDQTGKQIASTEDTVRWNLAAGETPVEIVVDVPDTAPPVEPAPALQLVVRGRIQQADATPLAGALVRAFDKDLRQKQLLGGQTTDAKGRYEIRYGRHQILRAEKQQADMIVRVLDADGGLLAASPVHFNAAAETTVDLVVGGGALREASEYEQLLAALAPALDGVEPAGLSPEEAAFLADRTGENSKRLGFLVQAHRLAAETNLPPAVFYGLARQGSPASLEPLLAAAPETWRSELETAIDENIVPLSLRAGLDAVIEHLDRLAEEAAGEEPDGTPKPSVPSTRLRLERLDDSLLTLLAATDADRDYVNEALDAELRTRLVATLEDADRSPLAAFIQTMPSVDLGACAETDLRTFMQEQASTALAAGGTMAGPLREAIATLSPTTTVGQLLALDQPVRLHPLFLPEARRLRLYGLLDTSPRLADRGLERRFLDLYAVRDGESEAFWQTLREDPDFKAPGLVEDIQLTLQLGRLTRDSLPLVAAIRARRGQDEVRTLRDLARLGLDDWQTLIREAARGRTRLPIPDAIPGDDDEVRLANYARVIRSELEAAFPTDFIAAVMEETPDLDLALVRRVLERYPDIDPTKPLTAALDPELEPEEEDRDAATMASLRRELNLYPETPYRDLLQTGDAWSNPLRVALARFFANAPDFDIEHHRVAAYLADNGDKAFAGIAEPHCPAVTAQLRRLQRLFQVTPHSAQVHTLLAEGLDSAYRIAAVPQQTFRTRMAAQLGGELEADAVYRNALRIVAGTLSLSGTHPPST